jgi:diaminopimelate epimerase
MELTKLHGLGNDYLYIDTLTQDLSNYDLPELSRVLSDRHFGVGSDGIILVEPSSRADFRMRIFNSDGSEAEMCGNGARGFAKYVFDHGLTTKTDLSLETGAGPIGLHLELAQGRVATVRADMGEPRLARAEIPARGEPSDQPLVEETLTVGDHAYTITCVSMGNPHCIIFVPEITDSLVHQVGPAIETHELFPNRTNVEFARVIDEQHVQMRVWERGAGETLACGTGASATAVAAALTNRAQRQLTLHLLGGDLLLEWNADNHVILTGPATEVFTAHVQPDILAPALNPISS